MAFYQNITPVSLGQTAITAAYTTIYTVPANTRTYLKCMDLCNTTAGAVTVTVNIVLSGSTANTANAIYYNTAIPGNTPLQWKGTQILYPGTTIQVKASATGVSITASGGEAT